MDIKKIMKKLLNRETILYGIFGVLTFLVGIIIYQGLLVLNVDYKIANIFSLVLGKLFAYVMNKLIVFKCKNDSFWDFCKEFVRFVIARGLTALIDYFGVIVAVECFGWNKVVSKYFFMILVIILNYVFGKKVVFKSSKNDTN